ncbi:unnamed protein product [Adineta steineri]|uniref:Uncharacterized protein n=1 Tax=Adineta steineri TaxID=433720 RepID=A0A816EDZ9_9BILA|nr:unnamed protein product [Adineta steineri]CAF1648661.1 unnamed protein product [Adineta steineri]
MVRSVNKMMESLIGQIKASNAKEHRTILDSVIEIAVRYRKLEQDTISIIQQTSIVGEQVRLTAKSALADEMCAADAFAEMDENFQGLSQNLNKAVNNHCQISEDLKQQVAEATIMKERNDDLAARAKEQRSDAKFYDSKGVPGGAMSVSGGATVVPEAAIFVGSVAGAYVASDPVDNEVLKVPAGTGGAIGNVLTGVAATVLAQILAGWSVRCATFQKEWSVTFDGLSKQILVVEEAIFKCIMYVSDVRAILNKLSENASRYDPSASNQHLQQQYKKISRSCKILRKNCDDYRQSLQISMGKMLVKIQANEKPNKT